MKILLVLILILLLPVSTAFAELYKWKDEGGKLHFTDNIQNVPEEYRKGSNYKTRGTLNITSGRNKGKRRFAPIRETLAVKGILEFDNELLSDISRVEPRFWFRNEATGKVAGAVAEYKAGEYEVYGLEPGNYGMSINVDLNPANPLMYPGDLRTWKTFSVSEKNPTRLNLNLTKLIYLIKPVDNGRQIPGWGGKCQNTPSISGPVTFEWKPLADNVYYDYSISKPTCKPFSFGKAIASGSTQDTKVTIPLEASSSNSIYLFKLNARKDGRTIGSLMTHGGNGHGWDYRFKVR